MDVLRHLEFFFHAPFFNSNLVQARIFDGDSGLTRKSGQQIAVALVKQTHMKPIINVYQPQQSIFDLRG